MKKIYWGFGFAFLVITVCMMIIVSRGVSLRTEPIIKPSPVDQKYENIAYGVSHRLFPELQTADYIVWGLSDPMDNEQVIIVSLLKEKYENRFGKKVTIVNVTALTTPEQIINCISPCWYTVKADQAHALSPDTLAQHIAKIKAKNYFSITFFSFKRDLSVAEVCETQQRLNFECILPVSVREASRFLKKLEARSFFMRRYNTLDYFLFIEE